MSPGKLRLKRTPEEQAARDLRKSQKAARNAAKKAHHSRPHSPTSSSSRSKRRRTDNDQYVSEMDDEPHTPYHPEAPREGPSSHWQLRPDWDEIRAQVEEERFRDKLWEALGDDERLDGVEARLNSYAHVPRRWRGGGMDRMDDDFGIDPRYMEDEDYAEWLRIGMWRYVYSQRVLALGADNVGPLKGRSTRLSTQNNFAFKLSARHVSRRRKRFEQKPRSWRELPLTNDAVERWKGVNCV